MAHELHIAWWAAHVAVEKVVEKAWIMRYTKFLQIERKKRGPIADKKG